LAQVLVEFWFQMSDICGGPSRKTSDPMNVRVTDLGELMNKKLLAFPLALALALCVCATSALAEVPKPNEPATAAKATSEKATSQAAAKLKKDMDKLVNEAKAGKIAPRPQQFPQTSRSNLSKTTKIALIATAIGTSIFLIVLFHDLSKD